MIVPWAAGCQVIGIFAFRELERERPRGLIGMTDISARKNVRATLGEHALSFTAPWPPFQEMEQNVEGASSSAQPGRPFSSPKGKATSEDCGDEIARMRKIRAICAAAFTACSTCRKAI